MEPLERSAATALESSLFGLVNFTASVGKPGYPSRSELRRIYMSNLRWSACHGHTVDVNAVQIFQRQHVSTSGSISVPSEIKASLLRALQAKRETHVNLLVTHSYLLTSTQHVIYLLYNYFYFY